MFLIAPKRKKLTDFMTNSTDPKTTNPSTPYRRTSDQLVSVQLIATVSTIVAAFFGFQWQLGNLVSGVSVQLTKSDLQIQELKADIAEIKARLK